MTDQNPLFPLTENISILLKNQWPTSLEGYLVTDVNWSHNSFEVVSQLDLISQNAIISTYNPPKSTKSTVKSREFVLVEELVVVDVLIRTGGSVEVALLNREAIVKWVQDTILLNQFGVSGQALVELTDEMVKAELPNLIRSTWLIKGTRFQIKQ